MPSIGLHLNAILMSSMDIKTNVTGDYSCSGEIQVGSSSALQETLNQTEYETREDADQDVLVEPALEELNLSSPKKKRQVFCFVFLRETILFFFSLFLITVGIVNTQG